jgi:hypothetical protein
MSRLEKDIKSVNLHFVGRTNNVGDHLYTDTSKEHAAFLVNVSGVPEECQGRNGGRNKR